MVAVWTGQEDRLLSDIQKYGRKTQPSATLLFTNIGATIMYKVAVIAKFSAVLVVKIAVMI